MTSAVTVFWGHSTTATMPEDEVAKKRRHEKLEKNNEKLDQIFTMIKRMSDEDSDEEHRSPKRRFHAEKYSNEVESDEGEPSTKKQNVSVDSMTK